MEPVNWPLLLALHPDAVCNVIEFPTWELTPSMMSISPAPGQWGPTVQKAGHVPQMPPGMCARSRMIRPCV